jgi:TetR/AcrR family transcriptional regulator, repressor of fatR-cypB operon
MTVSLADASVVPTTPPASDKRRAILAAALRIIARTGLHDAPISAVAREAGVAAGTLYLYFPSKEAMINALYLEVLADRDRAIAIEPESMPTIGDARDGFWRFWNALALWHLEHPDESSLLHQCQSSAILTAETRETELRRNAVGFAQFEDAVATGTLRQMSRQVFWALCAGPIFVLAQMRDSGELVITDDVLRSTFEGVCRSVLPNAGATEA